MTEDANTRYLDRMTELLGDSLFTIGNCAIVAVVLLQPQRRADAAAADVDRDRDREASDFPLSDYQIA